MRIISFQNKNNNNKNKKEAERREESDQYVIEIFLSFFW